MMAYGTLQAARNLKRFKFGETDVVQPNAGEEAPQVVAGAPEIQSQEIFLEDTIGDGNFGTVHRGLCRSQVVAVKVLKKRNWAQKALEDFRKEVALLVTLFHPNVCLFMGACFDPGNTMIVTEFLENGDLKMLIYDKKVELSVFMRLRMMRDAARGMTWLHDRAQPVLHRDLKPANLLVSSDWRVKLCDFGLSQILHTGSAQDLAGKARGSPLWMAPEVLMGREFNRAADVYSFGIVLWEVMHRQRPYSQFKRFPDLKRGVAQKHIRPQIAKEYSVDLAYLMKQCWAPDPQNRMDFKTVLQSLQSLMIDTAILDEAGRDFWKRYFSGEQFVRWSTWMNAFEQYLVRHLPDMERKHKLKTKDLRASAPAHQLHNNNNSNSNMRATSLLRSDSTQHMSQAGLSSSGGGAAPGPIGFGTGEQRELNVGCLRALLELPREIGGSDDLVNVEVFGRILQWLPLLGASGAPSFLDRIRNMLSKSWFHGPLATREAESLLERRPPGTFLVRFSSRKAGAFTVSKIDSNGKPVHHRIDYKRGSGLVVGGRSYATLDELLENEYATLDITSACPGSPYKALFVSASPVKYKYEDKFGDSPKSANF